MSVGNPAVATFIQEAGELIEGLEAQLLQLEEGASADLVDAVFRNLHTVKGSGAMFGFTELSRFTHHFEEAFDRVREGRMEVGQELINLSLQARDHMQAMLSLGGDGPEAAALAATDGAQALLAKLVALTGSAAPIAASSGAANSIAAGSSLASGPALWRIRFKPLANALQHGMRPDRLMDELATLGTVKSLHVDGSAVPSLDEIDPKQSYLAWEMLLETSEPESSISGVFIFAGDEGLTIERYREPAAAQTATAAETPKTSIARAMDSAGETVRVPSSRLDEIVDQLGELVIAQARLNDLSDRMGQSELGAISEEIGRLINNLRDVTMAIRMLPLETVFGKFRRVVRDLSNELGKEVAFETVGGATEIDKNVIDRLSEPLVHMIRNSVDHGIESGDARRRAGKTPRGRVRLSARQEGSEVLISLTDDGKGLDTDAIHAKAISRGLIAPDAKPTISELQHMIFAAGFSTAETVSKVSGRGVGMDAVKTAIQALRGRVEIISEKGRGTRITLRLPLSLAIIDGLLVRLGAQTLVIPLEAVEECIELDQAELYRESGRRLLQIRENLVPFLDLADALNLPFDDSARRRLVVVRYDGVQVGLIVDDIIGQHQTVIKPFAPYHRNIAGLSGATILGDGDIALIVEVASLVKSAVSGQDAVKVA